VSFSVLVTWNMQQYSPAGFFSTYSEPAILLVTPQVF
jgi:hypothetical protein